MRAGFFVRTDDGTVQSERSALEFNFPDRLAGVLDRPTDRNVDRSSRDRGARGVQSLPSFYRAEAAEPEPIVEELPIAGPQLLPAPPPRRKWPWLLAWAGVVLVAAVMGLRVWMLNSTVPEPIALQVLEHDGQLLVQWNPLAKPVAAAAAGSLEITDGAEPRSIRLSRQDLTAGKFTYVRKTGDIEVRMSVQDANGLKTEEGSRFLGPPPAPPPSVPDVSETQKQSEALEAEVDRLKRANSAQTAKIQQLERTIRILSTRLGIVDQGKQ